MDACLNGHCKDHELDSRSLADPLAQTARPSRSGSQAGKTDRAWNLCRISVQRANGHWCVGDIIVGPFCNRKLWIASGIVNIGNSEAVMQISISILVKAEAKIIISSLKLIKAKVIHKPTIKRYVSGD